MRTMNGRRAHARALDRLGRRGAAEPRRVVRPARLRLGRDDVRVGLHRGGRGGDRRRAGRRSPSSGASAARPSRCSRSACSASGRSRSPRRPRCGIGAVLFGITIYVPVYMQGVLQASATSSGVVLIPLTLGWVVAAFVGGQLISRTGRYKIFPLLGSTLVLIGCVLLTTLDEHSSTGGRQRLPRGHRRRHGLDVPDVRDRHPERGRHRATSAWPRPRSSSSARWARSLAVAGARRAADLPAARRRRSRTG